jgi:predicted porin
MKKILIATAVVASFASVAHAQSSVTLYGTLDAGITYTSNVGGHSQWAVGSGSIDENRFGLRGVEDLDGGMKTVFTLEQGFNLNNGSQAAAGKMFSRQAFVGLSSQAGTVTLGRQYDAMQDFVSPLTATGSWGGTNFAHYGNLDHLNKNSDDATNNSVKFTSANYAGFSFGATYGFSNNTQFANNRAYSVGAGYENAGLRVGAGYAQQNNPGGTTVGAYSGTDQSVIDTDGLSFRSRQFGAGASYAFVPQSSASHGRTSAHRQRDGQHGFRPRQQLRSQCEVQPDSGAGPRCRLHVQQRCSQPGPLPREPGWRARRLRAVKAHRHVRARCLSDHERTGRFADQRDDR